MNGNSCEYVRKSKGAAGHELQDLPSPRVSRDCWGTVLQCVAVCCSVLQSCVVVSYKTSRLQEFPETIEVLCCSVLQCVAVCCSVLQCVAVCYCAVYCAAVCCSVLQCVAVCCSVLQCVAVCCRLQRFPESIEMPFPEREGCMYTQVLHHTATHCNTLQHTAAHCNTLQHTATHCNTLQHTATHCNTLQHTATHCNTLHHTAPHCNTLQHAVTA